MDKREKKIKLIKYAFLIYFIISVISYFHLNSIIDAYLKEIESLKSDLLSKDKEIERLNDIRIKLAKEKYNNK